MTKCKKEHCWNYYSANDVVDKFGNYQNARHLVYYSKGEPQHRTCKHCGLHQRLRTEWEDLK